MKRLVYSPKVWAYIKGRPDPNTGEPVLYDVSPYIVSGSVDRRVNQVSSAEITLRNPDRIFTQLGNPAFLPMDPITIFLQRHIDKPVRVFTGWLDESPYYQMYPGTCSLKASCTLKKLQYTFWNPALPFVMSFLKDIGWAVDTSNGLLINPSTLGGGPVITGNITKTQLNDGSLGALLYAILINVGGWDPNNVWIENLPPDLVPWITGLFQTFQKEEDSIKTSLSGLLTQIIGTGSAGGGSGGTGSGSGSGPSGSGPTAAGENQQNVQLVKCIGEQYGVPPAFILATIDQECGFNPMEHSSCCIGWFQINCCGNFDVSGNPSFPCTCGGFKGISRTFTLAESQDLGLTCGYFCQSVKNNYGDISQRESSWRAIANDIQGCGGSCYGDWDNAVARANAALAQYGNVTCNNGQPNPGGTTSGSTTGTPTGSGNVRGNIVTAQAASVTSGAAGSPTTGGGSSGSTGTSVINPISGWTITAHDAGLDADAAVGTPIVAPADCTLCQVQLDWYQGQPLLEFHFDNNMIGAESQYWYVAEQITPVTETRNTKFRQGEAVAHFAPSGTGIEIGWGDPNCGGNGTLAGSKGLGDVGHQASDVSNSFASYFGITGGKPTGSSGGPNSGGGTGAGIGGAGGNINDPFVIAKATVFATELQWPSVADVLEAVALQGHKALMDSKPLLNFIQQVTTASMRSFMSAPNGDFYAFFPDYFGEFHHKDPYWLIDDVEVITGDIQLTDANLVTHMYVVGDTLMANLFPGPDTQLWEKVLSAGTVDIFDYFGATDQANQQNPNQSKSGSSWLHNQSTTSDPASARKTRAGTKTGGYTVTPLLSHSLHSQTGAEAFLRRYGPRPVEIDQPLVRSQFFEAFLSLQYFMLAWSMQFMTDFTFTFMPELYPGARVRFGPPHNIDMYINSVTHTFDYEQGFTTTAELMAPAAALPDGSENSESPAWGMVNAISGRSPIDGSAP